MTDPNLIAFVWNTILGGIASNVAYDGIKTILGKGVNKLIAYTKGNNKHNFEIALLSMMEANSRIEQQLSQLLENSTANTCEQNHYGFGDNVRGNKTEINISPNSIPTQAVKYNLTDKQKDLIKSLVDIGRTWREEFYVVWSFDPEVEISDILDYDGNPPNISKSDVRAFKRADLIDCEFLSEDKARITLTKRSYDAVDTNFWVEK